MRPSTSNPYESPRSVDTDRRPRMCWRTIGRTAVVLYGLVFTSFCIWGSIGDVRDKEPISETLFWFVLGGVMCFGIFAFAIPQLRSQLVARAWRYVAYAIPVLMYAATGWEIWNGERMESLEFAAVLTLFFIFTTPAVVFNFLLHRKLNATQENRHVTMP